ncbi:C-X-C motif chemokine 14 [Callorhinchus milii]|uniref:C-X-C motif chemokine 14 n=1 Tax=Callorhinchus milii TaxID=7868 RepID=V9LGL3_CALMI|nr:C-X-C motif chemokine 14 [Callorhinchus milii]|eukprot:gi/632966600/ref/XP_007899509.1/ PREDICTED: C-X-C motif chemokine 14 [Callorhinchus milii]
MKRAAAAALILLIIAIYSTDVEAYKCKCIRKGPKIHYKKVKKVEIKPRYPYCQEKMIFVTMQKAARFKGHQYCLHPKLQSTKNLIQWYNKWKRDHRVYEA